MTPTSAAPPSSAISTLILAAMVREARPFARALSLARADVGPVPAWRGDRVTSAVVGIGPAAAARATVRLLDAVPAARVLVVGIAGGRDPSLRVGDVLAPELVVDASSGAAYRPARFGTAGRTGTLATVGQLGAAIPDALEAGAVDMESAAIAAVCDERGVPWDVRRVVSDLPGTVGASLASLVGGDGRTEPWAVARLLVRRPAEVRRMIRLGRDTSRALRTLTTAVVQEIGR